MHVFYFDEVKFHPPTQNSFWLGGVCVPATLVPEIENEVNLISEKVFGSRVLSRETELHGQEIVVVVGISKAKTWKCVFRCWISS